MYDVGGKTSGITRDDILAFAHNNGIRHAQSIAKTVLSAAASFRSLARKNGVGEECAGRIETCMNSHLADWGMTESIAYTPPMTIDGHTVARARLEQAYKGNYHLLAEIDGKERKYIFRPKTAEYATISKTGISNIDTDGLYALVKKYMIRS